MNPQDLINAVAAERLGPAPTPAAPAAPAVDPAAAAAAAAAAQQTPPAPPAPPKADPTPTPQEKALAAAGAPGADDAAFDFIELDGDDGNKRQMTKQQIKSTLDRYSKLNHKHATMKPVLSLVEQMLNQAKERGHDAKPEEAAQLIQAAVSAFLKNPQQGGQPAAPAGKQGAQPPQGQVEDNGTSEPDDDESYSAWEKENAVKLPPGYKQQQAAMKQLTNSMAQLVQMVQQGMAQGGVTGQVAATAAQQLNKAQTQQVSAARMAIDNNIKGAMAQAGLQFAPETAQDFFLFAMQRGYSPEDFMDPELTATVASDYKANKDAPEVQRLREIAARRQAFTGNVEGAPGGATAPAPAADPTFASLVQFAQQRR
jgi:hypothetical protein